MDHKLTDEIELQNRFEFERETHFSRYNTILSKYKAQQVIDDKRGESLLDLACGDGYITALLKPSFRRIVGLDASKIHLDVARKRLPDVQFVESLLETYTTSEKFSTITMLDVLEHVQDPRNALQPAASHLSNDGVLIVHVPNAEAINRRIAVKMGTLTSLDELSPFDINIAGHRRAYTLTTLSEEIRSAGLKIKSTGGIFYKCLSTAQIDWFLENGLWKDGGFGWGRVGAEKEKDWRQAFCDACYEIGKERPTECNCIYVCATL